MSRGIAVREFPLKSGTADYVLFIDRKVVGVVEAKPQGTTLSGVAEQSQAYLLGIPANLPNIQISPPGQSANGTKNAMDSKVIVARGESEFYR